MAASWDISKYFSLPQFGSAVVHGRCPGFAEILALEASYQVGILRPRFKTVWKDHSIPETLLFGYQQMVTLNLQCSQVRKEESI